MVIRNVGFEKGKVMGKRTVHLPAGSVVDAASNPAHLSSRLGVFVGVYVPASRTDRKNDKVNIIKLLDGEVGAGAPAALPVSGEEAQHSS